MLKKIHNNLYRATVIALLASGIAACSSTEDEIDPNEPVELTEITEKFEPEVLWDTSVGDGAERYFSRLKPNAGYGKLFTASRDGEVRALDPNTGKEIWSTDLSDLDDSSSFFESKPSAYLSGGPSIGLNKVVIGSEDGDVFALDAETGQLSWHSKVKGEVIAAPAVDSGAVVVNTASGVIKAFNLSDGSDLWKVEQEVPALTLRGVSAPTISAGGALVGSPDGTLTVYLLENGRQGWVAEVGETSGSTELERVIDVDSSPVVYGDKVYSISSRGNLVSLDLRSGRILWERQYSSYRQISIQGNVIYLTDIQGHVYAIDRVNGVEQWSQLSLTNRKVTGPVVVGNFIVVGDFEGYLHWLDASNGNFVARHEVDSSGIYTTPFVLNDIVYVQARDGELQAIKTP